MKNIQAGSNITTTTNGVFKNAMYKASSTTSPSGFSVQNDLTSSRPKVEIPVGELTDTYTYFVDF